MNTSPFSFSHHWQLYWTRIPSNRPAKWVGESAKEKVAIEAIASIGIIGGVQLSRLFHIDKKRKKHMVQSGKLVRHSVKKNKQIIPVYTVGPTGAKMIALSDYEENYWVTYRVPDVLKRLLFFQLFALFPKGHIYPAKEPFSGLIDYDHHLFFIYVVRDDVQDLLRHIKWRRSPERIIVITESLQYLEPLNGFAEDLKLRVVMDQDLKTDFQNLFHLWDNGWKREKNQILD